MRTTKVLSITLPAPMLEEAQALAKKENRTMSELVREALRQYQREKRWEEINGFGRARAEAVGVRSEDDVVQVVHEHRREQRTKGKAQGIVAMRAVLDTNVFISALIYRGKPAEILDLIEDEVVALVYSEAIRAETERILATKFGWPGPRIEFACKPYWDIGKYVEPRAEIHACVDPDDDFILECAVEGAAGFIITGDKHLLTMVRFRECEIPTPDAFLRRLER